MEAPDSRVALFKSSNGDLWASVMDTGFLKISRSTDDGATWSPAPAVLNETIVEGQTQLTEFTDGGTFLGVAAAEDGDGGLEDGRYSQYMFYRLDLSNAGAFATGVQATAQLNIVIQPAAGESITIGGRTYTFRTAPIADVAGNIAIGATDDITKANLVNAINGGGAPGPNTYALSTFPHNNARISGFGTGTTAQVRAMEDGAPGNAINVSETMAGAGNEFTGAVTALSGGTSPWIRENLNITQGSSNAVVHADDELSLVTDTDNTVYVASETQRTGPSTQASLDPQVVLFRRNAGGSWDQSTVKLDQSSNTLDRKRPVVSILDGNLYVFAIDNGQTNVAYWVRPTNNIPVGLGQWAAPQPLFATQFEKHRNSIVPREPTTAATGLPVLVDWAWDDCSNCNPTSIQDTSVWQTLIPTNLGNQAPGVFAGTNKSVDASPPTNLGGIVTSDAVGSPVSWAWSVVSGPAGGVNLSPSTGSCSSTECVLPTTAAFSALGTYVLRLTATEAGADPLVNFDEVSITVNNLVNNPPVLTVSNPDNGNKFNVGAPVQFSATATDNGVNISGQIVWTSNRDGIIGFGGSFVMIAGGSGSNRLSNGTHIIKASVTDGQNTVTSPNISIVIGSASPPPPPPPDPENPFIDDNGHIFENAIEWLADKGITQGCNPPTNNRFCPDDAVTRGQMAVFLVRAFGYSDNGGGNIFTDDNGLFYENSADRLFTAGVTQGCNPPANNRFCGEQNVTRGQMAAFLVRAFGLPPYNGPDRFTDDNGHLFEGAIERLAQAGITLGCNPPANNRFCPNQPVTRGQMAAFLKRAFGE